MEPGPNGECTHREQPGSPPHTGPGGNSESPDLPAKSDREQGRPERDPVLEEIERIVVEVRPKRTYAPRESGTLSVDELPSDPPADDASPIDPARGRRPPDGPREPTYVGVRPGVDRFEEMAVRLEAVAQELRRQEVRLGPIVDPETRDGTWAFDHDLQTGPRARSMADRASARTESIENPGQPSALPPWSPASTPTYPDPQQNSHQRTYKDFTVDRYNRTVGSLEARHSRVAALTLLLSAGIGALLIEIVIHSPPSNPSAWIVFLPLVWMVPLPFFLLAFRGTHRILERNPLDLPEAK